MTTEKKDLEVKQDIVPAGAPSRRNVLPPFYQKGGQNFMKRAQSRDKDFRHRWVNKHPRNQHMKIYKGWRPLENKEKLVELGLGNLIGTNGRAVWMDVELWTMPMEVYKLIRAELDERLAAQSTSQREALDAMADDVTGRSRGMAVPFVSTGSTGDVLDRTQVAAPTEKK